MYRLSFLILILWCLQPIYSQSPHGESLKIDCAQCHNPSGWTLDAENIQFDHNNTDFELEGTHAVTDCKLCHTSLVFEQVKTDCVSCHLDMHSMTVGNDCMRCHDTNSWLVDNIPELHEENGFPLIGTHNILSCVDCHISETALRFDRLGNECISCHQNDYVTTQNPNHLTNGFSTDCVECHNPLGTDWDSAVINHEFFPLTLGHDIQDCSQCHDVNNFSNISPECVSCHQQDYTQTTNPNHVSANFSTDCVLCHTTNPGWIPAVLNHDFFPLTLGHAIEDCTACHINGNFTNTPTDCFACHQNDYAATTNPDHEAANFPTDCVACHTTNPGWIPATFDHDGLFFPIYSGSHDGEWNNCIDCHTNTNDYSIFTCITCHTQADTDDEHEDVGGYIYQSNACLSCHPNG